MGSIPRSLPVARMPFDLPEQANNTGSTMPGAAPLQSTNPMGSRLFQQGTNNQTYGAQAPKQPIAPAAPLPKAAAAPPAPASAPSATPSAGAGGGYTPDGMRQQLGNQFMSLLQGNNQAADIADNRASSQLAQMQKTADAGLQRQAAAMGIQPGDPRYQTFLNQNQAAQQSFGSRVLGENAQRRLEDQSRNLQNAAAFNQAQQTHDLNTAKFGEDTRRYDQDFAESQRRDNRNFGEDARRYDQDFGESARRYDQDFGESARRYNQDFGESSRRFDIGQGNIDREFGEDVRRFDVGQANNTRDFNESTRQFDVGQGNVDREFGENTRRYDQNFAEQQRLANQQQGNWAAEMGQRDMENTRAFNEGQRQFNETTYNSQRAQELNSLFDIVNNPLSSGGEVEAAKQRLFAMQGGLDPTLLAKKDPTYGAQARQEVEDWVRSAFPGKTEAEYQAMIAQRLADLDASTFGALNKGTQVDGVGTTGTNPYGIDAKAALTPKPLGERLVDTVSENMTGTGGVAKQVGNTIVDGGRKIIRTISDWF